jgi:hypothetical protein
MYWNFLIIFITFWISINEQYILFYFYLCQVIFDGLKARGHKFDIRERLGSSVQAILTMDKQENNIQNILAGKKTKIVSFSDPIRDGVADGV